MKRPTIQFMLACMLGLVLAFISVGIANAYVANKQWPTSGGDYAFGANYPSGNWQSRANEAAQTWTNVSTSSWIWTATGNSTSVLYYQGIDGSGSVFAATAVFPCTANPPFICRFTTTADSAETWYNGTGTPGSNDVDLRSVLTHEFGHAAWAGHTNASCSGSSSPTMCASYFRGTTYWRTLETDDRNGISSVYP